MLIPFDTGKSTWKYLPRVHTISTTPLQPNQPLTTGILPPSSNIGLTPPQGRGGISQTGPPEEPPRRPYTALPGSSKKGPVSPGNMFPGIWKVRSYIRCRNGKHSNRKLVSILDHWRLRISVGACEFCLWRRSSRGRRVGCFSGKSRWGEFGVSYREG